MNDDKGGSPPEGLHATIGRGETLDVLRDCKGCKGGVRAKLTFSETGTMTVEIWHEPEDLDAPEPCHWFRTRDPGNVALRI